MNSNGTQQRKLTDGSDPAWSPDGTEIAFNRGDDPEDFLGDEIYTINADGTGETRLTYNAVGNFAPAWSPTGQEIVLVRRGSEDTEIYVMNRDATNERRLTDNETTDKYPPGPRTEARSSSSG